MINEAVVRRVVGGSAAMREQLARLLEVADLPTVELHVLPFVAGAHAAMGSSFALLQLPSPQDVLTFPTTAFVTFLTSVKADLLPL